MRAEKRNSLVALPACFCSRRTLDREREEEKDSILANPVTNPVVFVRRDNSEHLFSLLTVVVVRARQTCSPSSVLNDDDEGNPLRFIDGQIFHVLKFPIARE